MQQAFDLLKFQIEGITDRDAPSLYNQAPERDLYTLWMDKADLVDCTHPLTPVESAAVSKAMALYKQVKPELEFRPAIAKKKDMPFIRALLDALAVKDNEVSLVRFVAMDAADLPQVNEGRIPARNFTEIQHQMLTLGLEKATFVGTVDGSQLAVVDVEADLPWQSNHVAECIQLWDCVRRGVPPKGAMIPEEDRITQPIPELQVGAANSSNPPPDAL